MPICIGRKISSISKKGSPQIIEIYGKLSSVGARSPCYIWSSSCLLYGWQERLQSKGCGVSSHLSWNQKPKISLWFYLFWFDFTLSGYRYRISSYSFRRNYSFLDLEIQRSQYIRPKVTVHKCAETIQGRKLYEEIR